MVCLKMLFLILLFSCAILSFVYFKYNNKDFWRKRRVVQVDGLLMDFIREGRSISEIYKRIYDKYTSEPYVGVFLGLKPALLVRDLENVQAIFAGDFQSFYSRGITLNPQDVLGDNILFIDDYSRWKLIRQKLSPVFTSSKLKNMFYILDRCGKDFVKRIDEDPNTLAKPFDALYTYTTASIAASIFGIDTNIRNTMDSPFLTMSKKSTQATLKTTIIFTIASIFPRLLELLNLKNFGEHEEFFVGVVRKVIEDRKQSKENRHDFIDICLELQDQGVLKDTVTGYELEPTVEFLAAQAFFFFIAGADTSANTMHFTLLELSNNPDILKRVHEEIDTVIQDRNVTLTFNDVEKLHYLDMVINEALRKYPPIGQIQRRCTKDTILPVGKLHLKENCIIVIPVYGIQRDEKYYPNPDQFDPERFSTENVGNIPKYAFLSFGEGNRNCLGMRFARLQVKAGLAWLLKNYTMKPQTVTPTKFEPSSFALRVPDVRYELLSRN